MPYKKLCSTILLSSLLVACGGSDDDSKPFTSKNNSDAHSPSLSNTIQTMYPDFVIPSNTQCDTSSNSSIVGCYVSNNCLSDDSSSKLLVADIRKNGEIHTTMNLYTDTVDCTGNAIEARMSALSYKYTVGNDITSSSGVSVTELNTTRNIPILDQLNIEPTIYYSSYYMKNKKLCLPSNDYNWSSSAIGFSFSNTSESNRAIDIDFENCLLEIN